MSETAASEAVAALVPNARYIGKVLSEAVGRIQVQTVDMVDDVSIDIVDHILTGLGVSFGSSDSSEEYAKTELRSMMQTYVECALLNAPGMTKYNK